MFTGNRGVLHNDRRELVTTRWRHKAWIVCELRYKDWRRELMKPKRWTELFFLDEATAFAAGHRPCGFCRRDDYQLFLRLSGCLSAKALDATLHAQRTVAQPSAPLGTLPTGAMFELGGEAYLKTPGGVRLWSHSGYSPPLTIVEDSIIRPLTPLLTRNVVQAGYPLRLAIG